MPGKLKKLSMPKREEMDMGELEIEMEPAGGDEMMAGEEPSDKGEAPSKESPLAGASDEELLAEMKKRGLMGELEGEGMSGEEELDMGDEEEYA
jgi:hypothetical protein